MWDFEHSVEAPVSRERVWAVWTDIESWPSWNPGVVRAELDRPFAEGASGSVRAADGPASKLKVVSVEPERRVVTEASERLMRLRFEHELDDAGDGQMRLTQRVQMTGLATPLMRRTIGPRLERSIPVALGNLVERAKTAEPAENA